VLKDEVFSSY